MSPQLRMSFDDVWTMTRDGDMDARALHRRHYSKYTYADGRDPKLFIGPGEKMCLVTPECGAVFVWRKFIDDAIPKQTGVNCAMFRNERPDLYKSSDLVLAAEPYAHRRWPGERLYTYVNPWKVRAKRDPGRCFRKAGWSPCGTTRGGLLILEKPPC